MGLAWQQACVLAHQGAGRSFSSLLPAPGWEPKAPPKIEEVTLMRPFHGNLFVKGERLVRLEVNAVMNQGAHFCEHLPRIQIK